MPDKYEGLYANIYGTEAVPPEGGLIASSWTQYLGTTTPEGTAYDPEWVLAEFAVNRVELSWSVPAMVDATHVAGFRRSGTDLTPFTPNPVEELFRVPVNVTEYVDENVPVGNYVYQVFSLVES